MWYWILTGCRYLQKWVTYSLEALCCIFCSAYVCSNKFSVCNVSKPPLVLHCFSSCCLCLFVINAVRAEYGGPKNSLLLLSNTALLKLQVGANLVPAPHLCLCSCKDSLLMQDGSKLKWRPNSSCFSSCTADLYQCCIALVSLECPALLLFWKPPCPCN